MKPDDDRAELRAALVAHARLIEKFWTYIDATRHPNEHRISAVRRMNVPALLAERRRLERRIAQLNLPPTPPNANDGGTT